MKKKSAHHPCQVLLAVLVSLLMVNCSFTTKTIPEKKPLASLWRAGLRASPYGAGTPFPGPEYWLNAAPSMASRFPQLQPFYGKGAVGETNNGLVAIRDVGALSLKEKADVNRLVEQENADRQALYTEIIKANNLDMGTMGELQRLFANSWRDRSSPGWSIQLDNGQWSKK
jgi:uncharacterized protein YdbL (DUF1318 family)